MSKYLHLLWLVSLVVTGFLRRTGVCCCSRLLAAHLASGLGYGAYTDQLGAWLENEFGIRLLVVKRSEARSGFALLPRRWLVERTFAWLGRYRRFSKDYERCSKSSEAMVYLASIGRLLNHLAD